MLLDTSIKKTGYLTASTRIRFQELNAKFGPFIIDAAASPTGDNAQL